MYKCNHCNITFSGKDDEGILIFRGKMYCKKCEEPVVEILDTSQTASSIHGAQATLISNSDNRITTNNYYGSETPDEQIDTPYGPCSKKEARFCKQCRQWIPLLYFNEDQGLCDNCIEQEGVKAFEEGKSMFEFGIYDKALEEFLRYELVCKSSQVLTQLQYYIGRCYFEQKQWKEAVSYFVKSRKNPECLFYLGQCFNSGCGVSKDEKKAFELIAEASQKGCQQATEFIKQEEKKRQHEDDIRLKNSEESIRQKEKEETERLERERLESLEMYRVEKNGRNGFLDRTGELVIPFIWSQTSVFSEGLVSVRDEKGKYGFIDRQGTLIVPCKWESASDFSEGISCVQNDKGLYGFVDKSGQVVSCWYDESPSVKNGIVRIMLDWRKFVFRNLAGNLISPVTWQDAYDFNEGMARVRSHDRYGFINLDGEEISRCRWKYAEDYSEGVALVKDNNDKYGFIDKIGNLIIPCKYQYATSFSERLAYVIDKDGKKCYINRAGEVVISFSKRMFSAIGPISEGLFSVQNNEMKFGYFDITGRQVIPCVWSSAKPFNGGVALVTDINGNKFIINKSGSIINIEKWGEIGTFKEGMAYVADSNGKYGFINDKGEISVPCIWKTVDSFRKGAAIVGKTDSIRGLIDKNGDILIPCKWEWMSYGTK